MGIFESSIQDLNNIPSQDFRKDQQKYTGDKSVINEEVKDTVGRLINGINNLDIESQKEKKIVFWKWK